MATLRIMKQEQIDNSIYHLRQAQALHREEIQAAESKIIDLMLQANKLDDPHAVIPKDYKTIEDWIQGHPFPKSVNAMRCKNKLEAENIIISCNTYQESYHIVKC